MSKKERKALEDAELDGLLAQLGVKEEEAKGQQDDKKVAAPATTGEGNSKNKKKKDKKKAKEEVKEEAKEEAKPAVELSPEEKAAAVKAAMSKRGAVQ